MATRPPARIAWARLRSIAAAMRMNASPRTDPTCTHFMRVPARVPMLISAVCGEEQAQAQISKTMPADTRKATPSPPCRPAATSATGSALALGALQQHGDHGQDEQGEQDAGGGPEALPDLGSVDLRHWGLLCWWPAPCR